MRNTNKPPIENTDADALGTAASIERFENEAEFLVVNQLDLLAQLALQIRVVNRTMRQTEQLRSPKYRVGPQLTPPERHAVLVELKAELLELDKHLGTQQQSCEEMHTTIDRMRARLKALLNLPSAATPNSTTP